MEGIINGLEYPQGKLNVALFSRGNRRIYSEQTSFIVQVGPPPLTSLPSDKTLIIDSTQSTKGYLSVVSLSPNMPGWCLHKVRRVGSVLITQSGNNAETKDGLGETAWYLGNCRMERCTLYSG